MDSNLLMHINVLPPNKTSLHMRLENDHET